ncbi:MAG: hypothetical protein QOE26_892 [Verrucomicrobiota bacterium]|jgi:hypothetical protein
MEDQTLLLRQVHPDFFQEGNLLSLAFRPSAKDEGLLSVYDGDQIEPEPSWKHYTGALGYQSCGVWAVSVAEAGACELEARGDPQPFPAHAVIDFTRYDKKQQRAKSKLLAAIAQERGCLYKTE